MMMFSTFFLSSVLFVTFVCSASSSGNLYCYSCSAGVTSTSGINCMRNVSAIRIVRCRRGSYCLTTFSFMHGGISRVRRTCQNPNSDHDLTTNEAPTADRCLSSYSRHNSIGSATCYYHCTSSRCNNIIPDTNVDCGPNCNGVCDINEKCVSRLSCVQCSSKIDKKCDKKTEARVCPDRYQNYCATTKTTTFSNDMTVADTTITKSCARISSFSPPQHDCFFSTSTRYNEAQTVKFSCSDFCTTNGCNTNIPAPETFTEEGLYCVVCSQTGSSKFCASKTTSSLCPAKSTHCKSTVTYYLARNYERIPSNQIASVVRECVSEAVEPLCSTSSVTGSEVELVTCTETCQDNGCNAGWPARPMCVQCNGTKDDCGQKPPAPTPCRFPIHSYCTIENKNAGSVQGYATSVIRRCSHTNIGTACSDTTVGNATVRNCQLSCNTSGCNQGPPPSS